MDKKAFLLFCLVAVPCLGQKKKVVETDNIAVEQHGAPFFAVPAPGVRLNNNRYESPSNNIGNAGGNFVGHLLPLHPAQAMPSIVALDVKCGSREMLVSILFDQPFNGIIYSKGFYGAPECTYLAPNSRQKKIQFELGRHGGCGVQYLEPPGAPGYMEGVVIIQNEPGIQEIWDTARGLRCMSDGGLAEGRNRQVVSAALNVDMLEQHVVTFSSDAKASASMDIQVGRGPFAPSASGLVKIGELMTMVVSVEGPSDMDVLVRQCIAHDGTNDNTIDLTDQRGCVIKKKIIGSWQKKSNTGTSGSPVVAYAHFQAFKFPDKMDVYIECEVDLCNGKCDTCDEDDSHYNGRKRRSLPRESTSQEDKIPSFEDAIDAAEERPDKWRGRKETRNDVTERVNKTENAGLRLAKRLRVLSPEDISLAGDQFSSFTLVTKTSSSPGSDDVCVSVASFVIGIVLMLVVIVASSALTAVLCVRVRTIPSAASSFPPDSSFHAFSTVSGKTT